MSQPSSEIVGRQNPSAAADHPLEVVREDDSLAQVANSFEPRRVGKGLAYGNSGCRVELWR